MRISKNSLLNVSVGCVAIFISLTSFAQSSFLKLEDFNLAIVHSENFLEKQVSFDALYCLQNYNDKTGTLDIRVAKSENDCYNRYIVVILKKDSPDFDEYAVTSPLKPNQRMQINGTFKRYQNISKYYVEASSISSNENNSSASVGSAATSKYLIPIGIAVIVVLALLKGLSDSKKPKA